MRDARRGEGGKPRLAGELCSAEKNPEGNVGRVVGREVMFFEAAWSEEARQLDRAPEMQAFYVSCFVNYNSEENYCHS